jgi:hypothetical protein
METPPLLCLDWVDSCQPVPAWRFIDDIAPQGPIRVRSVGWLVRRDARTVLLAPNLGNLQNGDALQASGVIEIPICAIVRERRISVSSAPASARASRPAKARTRQA